MSNQMDSGQPNSQPEPGQAPAAETVGAQPSSPATPFTAEQIAFLKEQNAQWWQGKEDRATARLEKSVTELQGTVTSQAQQIERITELAKKGFTPAQIEDQLVMDDLLAERKASRQPQQPVPSTNGSAQGATANTDYQAIYSALGVNPNDPEVLRMTKEAPNVAALTVSLAQLKTQREAAGSNVSVGAVQVSGGGAVSSSLTQIEALTNEVNELIKNPGSSPAALAAKSAELERLIATQRG